MKRSLFLASIICLGCLAAACDQTPALRVEKPTAISTEQRRHVDAQAFQVIREVRQAADQSGLTALMGGTNKTHSWQNLDAYYQGIDQLAYSEQVKAFLKQRALYTLVQRYPFLAQAPLARKDYYAEQLLAQPHPDPKLLVAFIENLQPTWPAAKTEMFKTKAREAVKASISGNGKYLTSLAEHLNTVASTDANRERLLVNQQHMQQEKEALSALGQKLASH